MSTIAAIRVYRADLPLAVRLEHASASEPVLEEVFMGVVTVSGAQGLAEVRGNGSYATGTDTATLLHEASDVAGPAMLGADLAEASAHVAEVCATPLVRALADSAVLDAVAREAGQPLWQVLGGRRTGAIPTHAQIGFCGREQAVELARSAARAGFGRVKMRVGRPRPDDDVAIVRAVCDALGEDVVIAIDANGAWDAATAIATVQALAARRIAWVEQPTRPGDDDALSAVRRAVEVPVVADEAVRTREDLQRLCAAGAVDGVHLKLEKAGTVAALADLAAQARDAGLLVFIGQMDQGRLGSSVTTHLAAAIAADAYELWGFQNIAHDVTTGLDVRDGRVGLPAGPGTGVVVDMEKLTLVREVA
jgi:L-alanine-DL-glutamate epimerase-like enolase superfamily enzyme